MTDQKFKRYNIYDDEALIVKAMVYLQYNDPDVATREDAISLLAFMQTFAKSVATQVGADDFDAYYKAYKEQKAKQ